MIHKTQSQLAKEKQDAGTTSSLIKGYPISQEKVHRFEIPQKGCLKHGMGKGACA